MHSSEANPSIHGKSVMVVYGTRPEAIKLAPVIKELEASQLMEPVTVVTGQHRSMLDQVNSIFGITPNFDLDLFEHGQTLNSLSSKLFSSLDEILRSQAPDAVVVQGDTTTVMASAVAAFYRQIPVVHLEAGLRSHDIHSPFPEEANRKIVSQVSSLHLAPTPTSKKNLLSENLSENSIVVTGNTVIDALLHTVREKRSTLPLDLQTLGSDGARLILVTSHRRENWGDAMEGVGRAIKTIASRFPNDHIVIPAHKNPIVRSGLLGGLHGVDNVHICEPLPYGEFALLLNAAHLVLTDSGGIQEEAPTLGKPVLVMRKNTERPEAVLAGSVRLVGTDEHRIVEEVSHLITSETAYESMARAINPYGDGMASRRSVAAIENLLGLGNRIPDFEPGVPVDLRS